MPDRYASLKQGLVGCWIPSVSGSGLLLPDLSGRGNNGVLTNMGPEDWVSSQYGRALDFDGSNDRIELRAISYQSLPLTVAAWVKPSTLSGVQMLASHYGAEGNRAWYLGLINNAVRVLVSPDGTLIPYGQGGTVNTDWTHVVGVVGQSAFQIYLNGIAVSTTLTGTYPTQIFSSTANIVLGDRATTDTPLNGQLDDIRIYNRVLSTSEIRLLSSEPGIGFKPAKKLSRFSQRFTYQPPKAKTYGVVRVKETDHANLREGLVGAWCPSIAGSGNLLPDVSGYGNHGTLTNMAADDWVSSQYGRALDFDGTNDLVDFGNLSLANFGTQPFSVALWLKAAPFTAQTAVFSKDDWDLGTSGLLIYSNTGSPNKIWYYSSGTTGNLFGTIADDTWHHIAVSRQSTGSNATRMYLDGRLITTLTDTLNYSNTKRLRLGNDDDGNRSFPGSIDDARIYNRALTDSEIKLLASRPGIGLRQEQHRQTFYQFPSGSRRRLLLTGQT